MKAAPLRQSFVHRISTAGPDDVSELKALIGSGAIEPENIVSIMGKTEGNGCVNDFTRGFASAALKACLSQFLPPSKLNDISIIMSGGTEGALAPHILVFEVRKVSAAQEADALAIGTSITQPLRFSDLGRIGQTELVAEGVRAAMQNAGIVKAADVHFVQIKCPLLTLERIEQSEAAGKKTATRDTLKSMGLSRAASSIGVALALEELDRAHVSDAMIGSDFRVFSEKASASAGVELLGHEILVMGNAPGWCGPLRSNHCVMRDAIDIVPVRSALEALGIPDQASCVALLAKAEASSNGQLRGFRHTMLNDSDISSTRHARAFVAGALAGLVGHAEIYVSGGAEHQGPDGGGPICIIATQNTGAKKTQGSTSARSVK